MDLDDDLKDCQSLASANSWRRGLWSSSCGQNILWLLWNWKAHLILSPVHTLVSIKLIAHWLQWPYCPKVDSSDDTGSSSGNTTVQIMKLSVKKNLNYYFPVSRNFEWCKSWVRHWRWLGWPTADCICAELHDFCTTVWIPGWPLQPQADHGLWSLTVESYDIPRFLHACECCHLAWQTRSICIQMQSSRLLLSKWCAL